MTTEPKTEPKPSNHRKPIKYTYKKVKAAIKKSGGIKLRVCEILGGMSRGNLEHCIKKWPDLQQTLEEAKDEITDLYEEALHTKAIEEKDIKAIMFYLRYSKEGRKRGYGYTTETQPVNVNQFLNELSDRIEQGGKPLDTEVDTETEED